MYTYFGPVDMSPICREAHMSAMNYFCDHMTVYIPRTISRLSGTRLSKQKGAFHVRFVEDLRREFWIPGAQSRRGWRTSFEFWWLAQHQIFKGDFEY